MIRYYTYYSFGGYKDLYLGDSTEAVIRGYYRPLANASDALPEDAFDLTVMTDDDYASMPRRLARALSYGGFDELLVAEGRDGAVSLVIRDIPSQDHDELGKNINFVIGFTADREDADLLYGLFKKAVRHHDEVCEQISNMLHYDPVYNGLCFEAQAMRTMLAWIPRSDTYSVAHAEGILDNIVVTRMSTPRQVVRSLDLSPVRTIVYPASRFAPQQ